MRVFEANDPQLARIVPEIADLSSSLEHHAHRRDCHHSTVAFVNNDSMGMAGLD
jgi:hypothetical protein